MTCYILLGGGGVTTAFRTDKYDLNPTYTYSSLNEQYTPIGYGNLSPKISITSPENTNYSSDNISLAFTTNKPLTWQGYSLDGKGITAITGNNTFLNVASGQHNITFYAIDSFGNNATSQTVVFRIAKPDNSTTTLTAIGSGVTTAMVCLGAIFYFKKRKTHV